MSSKKIVIFPYMLARVGGLPFSVLVDFRLEEGMDFDIQFSKFQLQLQNLSHSEVLLKGALQTSDSFFERIIRYQNKTITDFRKKENQTQRSVFQYLARTVGKTSPFSTLTTLSPFHLKGQTFKNIPSNLPKSNVRFNNQLVLELKKWIFNETEVLQFLELFINPTLNKEANDFVFFTEKNEEKIQRIEINQVIEIIIDNLITPINFNQLINQLIEIIDADKNELSAYVLQLIELGLIEVIFPNLIELENPFDSFHQFINDLPEFKQQDVLLSLLSFLKKKKLEFKNSKAQQRLIIKKQIIKALRQFGLEEIPLKYLFYEDVGKTLDYELEVNHISPILAIADGLADMVAPLMYDSMLSKVISFFEKTKLKSIRINLLEFVEQFFKQDFPENERYKKEIEEIRFFWKNELKNLMQLDDKGNLNFLSKDLLKIHQKVLEKFPFVKNKNTDFYSGHFQFFKEKEIQKAVINGMTSGHGKLYGRFSHFFPDNFIQDLRAWNKSEPDEIWVQNSDATVFNANNQDCFFDKKIGTTKEDISLGKLEIEWKEGGVVLYHKLMKKEIRIFDTGIVEPNQRSEMFQILKLFGVPHTSFSVFCNLVNELLQNSSTSQKYPRITIDNQLVIQRKSQILSQIDLPNQLSYADIMHWKNKYFNSDLLFLKILNQASSKPQLIDFQSPLSVLVLKKIINSKPEAIQFVEMLPSEKDLIEINEENFCTEFILQWKKEK